MKKICVIVFLGFLFLSLALGAWGSYRVEKIDLINKIYLTNYGQLDFLPVSYADMTKLIPQGSFDQKNMVTIQEDVTIRGQEFWISQGHIWRIFVSEGCSHPRNIQKAQHWVRLRNGDILANFQGSLIVTIRNQGELAKEFSVNSEKAEEIWWHTCRGKYEGK